MAIDSRSICSLCGINIQKNSFFNEGNVFCCTGCQAVYTIIKIKDELDKKREHPLFFEALAAGIISNPLLLEELKNKQKQDYQEEIEKKKIYFSIQGMWCPSCALLIQYVLGKKGGVVECIVDYSNDLACLEYQPRYVTKEKLFQTIQNLGYITQDLDDKENLQVEKKLKLRTAITGFFALNVMMFAYPLYATYFDPSAESYGLLFAWLSCIATVPIMTYGAWPIYKRWITALKTGFFGVETLVVLGSGSAVILSLFRLIQGNTHVYFDTAAVIVALVLTGKAVESKAKFNLKQTLFRLAKTQPRRGRKIFPSGEENYVPITEIRKGDLIKTQAGERIILDGVVVGGEGACNEAILTGEGLPAVKGVDSLVIGGSTLLNGSLTWKVSAELEESLQQRILQTVQLDLSSKSSKETRLQKILYWFTPSIVLCAIVVGLYVAFIKEDLEGAFVQALSVLLIACPCALGIAIPLVESRLIQRLAEQGALVRNRRCLSLLGKEDLYVFDKTGTITDGSFNVVQENIQWTKEQQAAVKSIAGCSIHPIAQALVQAIQEEAKKAEDVCEYISKGMIGKVNDKIYRFGSQSFLVTQQINIPSEVIIPPGCTACWITEDDRILGTLFLGDRLRAESKTVIPQLNVETTLLSGDIAASVSNVAKQCSFTNWYAAQSPLDKREYILNEKSKKKIVAMVGDGINDAPALTAAHIGISVVSATDMSVQVSDILLTTDQLSILTSIRQMASRGRRLIQQNLFWTFFYNILGIGLALSGSLSPIYAAFAMVTSSLLVVFNAQRMK